MKKRYITEQVTIPVGDRSMRALLLKPLHPREKEKTPGVLWIHGGGYCTGMPEMIHFSRAVGLVERFGAVVLTPDYRLAGQSPYPAALEDCYAALLYLAARMEALGAAPHLLAVGGESAGGGLTAAVCMAARDRGEVSVAFQTPLYPMLDDRDTPSSRRNFRLPWNTWFNHMAWRAYLRDVPGDPPPLAAPARQTDYAGLPPCYTFVGDREPFCCETLAYVDNLRKAGVEAHADVYPTGCHAFDMLTPFRRISRQARDAFEARFAEALDLAP